MGEMTNKILIHDTDEMFIPYGIYNNTQYILGVLWNSYNPFNKQDAMQKYSNETHISVSVETERGGKIITFIK
jgi:hypothetical protein